MIEPHHPFRSEEAKQEYLAHYDGWAKQWPIPSDSIYVETSFGKTFVRKCGSMPPSNSSTSDHNRHQPPLVLLPGDAETSLAWIQVLKAGLSNNSRRIYAVDHIDDVGRSICCHPLTKATDYVRWLDELITSLLDMDEHEHELDSNRNIRNSKKVNLMGHSYGGWQVALYAAAHPDRVNKLVLLSPNGVLRPRLEVLLRAISYWFFPTKSNVRQYLYWYAPCCVQKDEDTRLIVDTMVEETLLYFQCFKRRNFVPPSLLTEQNCWNPLKQVPTLFLIGDHEVTFLADKAIQHLKEVAPLVKGVKVANADHHLALCQPELINNMVQEFLEEQPSGS